MTPTISPDLYGDLVQVASEPGFTDWQAMVRNTGGCAEPVHLWGESRTIHTATGELLTQREPGKLLVGCGNRRKSRCPSCSETYRADTFQLIKAGLVGGKNVPDTVTDHPKVFATFTAPSFGPVHHYLAGPDGQTKQCHPHGPSRCQQRHHPDDPLLGQPLDPDTYDYVGAVIWNALATRLWARTVQLVNRHAARQLGIPQRHWFEVGRISVAKVAEYQARGVVHFHAIFRLDGANLGDPPPVGATADVLSEAIRNAADAAWIQPPDSEAVGDLRPIVWGEQLDLRPVTASTDDQHLSDSQVAGYLAKYATKGAEASGTADRPLACRACQGTGRRVEGNKSAACPACAGKGTRQRPQSLKLGVHAQAMIDTCWRLGGLPELEYLRLRPWAHMLGFRGHYSTKSRRYSTTLGCLRRARQQWRTAHTLGATGLDPATPVARINLQDLDDLDLGDRDEDRVLVVGHWRYVGRGHSPGEAIYAATIAHDLAEGRRIWREQRSEALEEPRREAA
jgi:hypothetical protein